MGPLDIVLLVFLVIVVIVAGLYFLNKWAYKRMDQQQSIIDRAKQVTSIYVIDKAKMKAAEANLPKAVQEQLPRMYKMMKVPLVKAKIGPQVVTLMCDKAVYDALPVKKNVKVEIAGIYIVSMPGMKTKQEMKERQKAKAAASGSGKPWDKALAWIKGK